MIDNTLGIARRFIPAKLFDALNPTYHLMLAFSSALWYRFPSRKIKVIAVTGTKGKSSTAEILNAILEEAGCKTALSNTIRFKIGGESRANLYKMSMPGRGFMQQLLREAVDAGCGYFVMEMTSQGALTYRHRFIELDALVFTNISPEHIEAHGSYEDYLGSKLDIARSLARSRKSNRTIIVNSDDKEAHKFLAFDADRKISYSIHDVGDYKLKTEGLEFSLHGQPVRSALSGLFNLYNMIAAITTARAFGVGDDVSVRAIERFAAIPGRVERIKSSKGFEIVVDYAHTPDSLEKFYQVFRKAGLSAGSSVEADAAGGSSGGNGAPISAGRNICILGGTGGGRDTWKRNEMGRIADMNCHDIILTNEDPYDEDPKKIVADVAAGIKNKRPTIIMDRREAIREAVRRARHGDSILITGKGTDPYIMGPNGAKTPWSDAGIAEEELQK